MHTNLTIRIMLDAAVIGCILFGWWYIALPLAVLCAWAALALGLAVVLLRRRDA